MHIDIRFKLSQSLGYASMLDIFDALGDSCPSWIEVDVDHGGDHRPLGEQGPRPEALLEEVSSHLVFGIGLARDGLLQELHERGDRAEFLAHMGKSALVSDQLGLVCLHDFRFDGLIIVGSGW